jgi:hypothetical protein
MMQQIATLSFDHATRTIQIDGELQPVNPIEHEMLAELVAGKIKAVVSVKDERNIVTYSLTVSPKV